MNKRLALVIGTNYPGTSFQLAGCVNDAHDWNELLEARGFDTHLLLDDQATRDEILAALEQLTYPLGRGDLLVVTYSGHGTWVPDSSGDEADNRDEAICPTDLRQAGVITDDDLYNIFSARTYGSHIAMISDSCFSGTLARLLPPLTPKPDHHAVRFLPPEQWVGPDVGLDARWFTASKTPARGRMRSGALVLTGCGENEYSYDANFGGRPNGAFTRVAIDALSQFDAALEVRYRDWWKAIRGRLPSVDYPQSPQLDGTTSQKNQVAFG